MKCQEILERVEALAPHRLSETENQSCVEHITGCDECQSALRGTETLRLIRNQREMAPPNGLFEKVLNQTTRLKQQPEQKSRFWLGAGIGSAVAATILVAVMSFWLITAPAPSPAEITTYQVSLDEPRDLNIAIDLERAMPGATLRVVLSGGIELDGYGSRRELTWTADLIKGVNRLTLPIMAINDMGGQLLVQVEHENRRKTLRVDLRVDT